MTLNVIDKVNSGLKFLHRQSRFLTPSLRKISCNALIQPLSDYACTAWFSNLSKKQKQKKLTLRLKGTQNKYLRFCLQLDKMSRICT